MYKVLIFGGTTEGRILAEKLCSYNISVTVSVATLSGRDAVTEKENLKCVVNRLNSEEMEELIKEYNIVVDATHPYASEVTENIIKASTKVNIPYLRLLRCEQKVDNCVYVKTVEEAVDYVDKFQGNILLTTGSKDLHKFTSINDFKDRVYARVLPSIEVMEKCFSLGLTAKNIISIMGPFSLDMNIALIKKVNAKFIITKESGSIGGFSEKVEAATKTGAKLIVIGRPLKETGYSLEEVEKRILSGFNIEKKSLNPYFPMFVDLKDKNIIVFGGGNIALRRINTLLKFNCNIKVIAPTLLKEIKDLHNKGRVSIQERGYVKGDCTGYDIALSLTNNRDVNCSVYSECKGLNIPCNIVDSKEECSFYFPGIALKDNLVVGVTASGQDHKLAKEVTNNIKAIIE